MNNTQTNKISISNHLQEIGGNNIKEEIITGLVAKQKYISPKYFYDKKGSELFEEITHLKEYYPTRTEKSILSSLVKRLDIDFNNASIIELGSGDPSKIIILLNQLSQQTLNTINYYPVDISPSAVNESISILKEKYSLNNINGIIIDFMAQLNLIPKDNHRIFCFFGSTIGNFNRKERSIFIKLLSNEMQAGDELILGLDMVKNTAILENAYNDSQNITADFNKNILSVVNKHISSDFNIKDFEHYAFFNTIESRIEMHLRALKNISISIDNYPSKIELIKGESIHTENSYKFTNKDIIQFTVDTKLEIVNTLNDENKWFSIIHLKKK